MEKFNLPGPQTATGSPSPAKTESSEFSTGKNIQIDAPSNRGCYALIRQGKPQLEIPSKHAPAIQDLAWDKDNDSLAILTVSLVKISETDTHLNVY